MAQWCKNTLERRKTGWDVIVHALSRLLSQPRLTNQQTQKTLESICMM